MRARTMLKWIKRIVLGAIGLVLLLVAIAVAVVHTKWGREKMRHEIEAQLQAQYPGSQVGSVEGSPLRTLTVSGITIAGKDGKPFVSVSTVRVSLSFIPLLRSVARVDSIEVDDVLVDMAVQPDAKPRTASTSATAKPSPWTIDLPSLTVRNARVLLATGERIDDIQIDGGLQMRDGKLASTVELQAKWRGQAVDVAALVNVGKTLDVPYVHVSVGAGSITAAGVHVALDGPLTVDGSISASAPAALIRAVAAKELEGKVIPGDIALVADARSGQITLAATIGPTRANALIRANVDKLAGEIVFGITDPHGRAALALTGDRDHLRGIVTASGNYDLEVSGTKPTTVHIDGGAIAAIDVVRQGDAWQLVHALVSGMGKSPITECTTTLFASGALTPAPKLSVSGTVDGHRIESGDLSIADAHVAFDARDVPAKPIVTSRVDVEGIRKGMLVVPRASVTTTTTFDFAAIENASAGSSTIVDLSGPMLLLRIADTPNPPVTVDLQSHRVETSDGKVWAGNGGRILVDDQKVVITQLHTGTGSSTAVVNATISRITDDLALDAKVKDVALAMFDPKLRGMVDGDISVKQHHGGYNGHASVDARGVVMPGHPAVSGHVAVTLAGRRVRVDGTATSAVGNAQVALEITGPRDIADAVAWQRLERSSVKTATIGVSKIDGVALGGLGTIDGQITLTATDAQGSLHASNIVTKYGTVDTTLSITGTPDQAIAAHVDAALTGVKPVSADATLVLPKHPFDPNEWAALGRGAIRNAAVHVDHLTFDHTLLVRFGQDKDFSGTINATVTLGAGATTGTLAIDLGDLHGPTLRAPVQLHLDGTLDGRGISAVGKASMGKALITLSASSPITVDIAAAGNVLGQKLTAQLTVPKLAAKDLLALLGRRDIEGGDVTGTIDIAGTVGAPTGHAHFGATNLTIVPTVSAKKPPKLETLDVDARWAANHGEVDLTGVEAGGKLLKISARGTLGQPQSVVGSIEAAAFDIAPIVAFAPGALGAARGTLDGAVTLTGIDPATGDVRGRLHITDGRLPLAPTLGTLRKGDIDITIAKHEVTATLDAKLGAGSIKGKVVAKLVGALPTEAELKSLELRKLSPIGAIQPIVDADVSGKFTRTGTKWNGKLLVSHANVYVPPDEGVELLDTGTPADMFFVNEAPPPKPVKIDKAPWLDAEIEIGRTTIVVDYDEFQFEGSARGDLFLKYGAAGMVLTGDISTERGTVEVLGRRYQLDHGVVAFEGTVDPRLDMRMIHDFDNLTLTVDVYGHSSNPGFRFAADPGNYTQGQLFAFFAGAEPGSDSGSAAGQAVVGGSLSFLTSKLGRKVTKHLPFKIDNPSYEAATATSSAALRSGIRLSKRSHLWWRVHPQARPDENPGEAVLEYIIKPWALIEATGGGRGGGGDLLLRKRW